MRKLKMEELGRLSVEEFKKSPKIPVIIVLDDIRSLNNIGSVFRTADAFRVNSIHLCGITARPPHREINKTALGATESVKWQYFDNIQKSITWLKDNGFTVYAVEQVDDSKNLIDYDFNDDKRIAVIFGNEVNGVSQEIMDKVDGCLEIPQYGTKHSLNIAVSVGIIAWQLFLKFKKIIT
jgi:tRNA G18 (ribose-2'-O)-methylase SpoU